MNTQMNTKQINVAFYSRVSTDEVEQIKALSNHADILKSWIADNENWNLTEKYLDEGISGLSIKKRLAFRRMLNDAKSGKFQVIIIKSISRFGRNMTDTSAALDLLLSLNIRVIFLEDRIDSINPGDIQKFGLFAWLAEMESRKTSERVTMTLNKQQKEGKYVGKPPYGYTRKDGKLYINQQSSEIIKLIFNLYQDGLGNKKIMQYLNENNYPAISAKEWNDYTISHILRNPVYIGDTYTNKMRTVDIKQRKRQYNDQEDWLYFSDTHEAIIDRETFQKVQNERDYRREKSMKYQRPSSVHLFSNLITCGRCDSSYRRVNKAKRQVEWSCYEYETKGKNYCSRETVKEATLIEQLQKFFNYMRLNKEKIKESTIKEKNIIVKSEMSNKNILKELQGLRDKQRKKLSKLLDLYTEDEITKKEYVERSKPINEEIERFVSQITKIEKDMLQTEDVDKLVDDFLSDLDTLCNIEKWTNQFLKKYIHTISVNDKENIDIILTIHKNSHGTKSSGGGSSKRGDMHLVGNDDWCQNSQLGTIKIADLVSESYTIHGYMQIPA